MTCGTVNMCQEDHVRKDLLWELSLGWVIWLFMSNRRTTGLSRE